MAETCTREIKTLSQLIWQYVQIKLEVTLIVEVLSPTVEAVQGISGARKVALPIRYEATLGKWYRKFCCDMVSELRQISSGYGRGPGRSDSNIAIRGSLHEQCSRLSVAVELLHPPLFFLEKQICPRTPQIDYFWTAITILLQPRTLKTIKSVRDTLNSLLACVLESYVTL